MRHQPDLVVDVVDVVQSLRRQGLKGVHWRHDVPASQLRLVPALWEKRIKTSLSRVSILTFICRPLTLLIISQRSQKYLMHRATLSLLFTTVRETTILTVLTASWKTRAIWRFGGAPLQIFECWRSDRSWLKVVKW